MRDLKRLLRLSILTLVVFSSSSMINESYAYWASNITGNSDTSSTSATVGTWTFIAPWNSSTSYNIGDIVTNVGGTYQAKKSGILREPGVDGGWARDWTQIG